jgi:hypothetical protein
MGKDIIWKEKIKMAVVEISGASDDLVHVNGIEGGDEFSISGESWAGVLEAPNGDTAIVYVDYRDNGCWTSSLGLYEEDYSLPEWPISVTTGETNSYTTSTKIVVPDGTKLTPLKDLT